MGLARATGGTADAPILAPLAGEGKPLGDRLAAQRRSVNAVHHRLRAILLATAPPLPQQPAAGASARERAEWLWRRAQHGWPAAYPLAQFPNAPLLLSFAASWLTGQLTTGDAAAYARAAASVLLACWAWLELTAGVNLWRRLLGAAFLVATIADLGQRIT